MDPEAAEENQRKANHPLKGQINQLRAATDPELSQASRELRQIFGDQSKYFKIAKVNSEIRVELNPQNFPQTAEERTALSKTLLEKFNASILGNRQSRLEEGTRRLLNQVEVEKQELYRKAAPGPFTQIEQASLWLESGLLKQDIRQVLEARQLLFPLGRRDLPPSSADKASELLSYSNGVWMKFAALKLIDGNQKLDSASYHYLSPELQKGFESRKLIRQRMRELIESLQPTEFRGSALSAAISNLSLNTEPLKRWETEIGSNFFSLGKAGWAPARELGKFRVDVPFLLADPKVNHSSEFTDQNIDERVASDRYDPEKLLRLLDRTTSLAPGMMMRQAAILGEHADINRGSAAMLLSDMLKPTHWMTTHREEILVDYNRRIDSVALEGRKRIDAEKDPQRAEALIFATGEAVAYERMKFAQELLKKNKVRFSEESTLALKSLEEIYSGNDRRRRTINEFFDTVAVDGVIAASVTGAGISIAGAVSLGMRRLLVRRLGEEVLTRASSRIALWALDRGLEGLSITTLHATGSRLLGDRKAFDGFGEKVFGSSVLVSTFRGINTAIRLGASRILISPKEVQAVLKGMEGLTDVEARNYLYSRAMSGSVPLRALRLTSELTVDSVVLGLLDVSRSSSNNPDGKNSWSAVLTDGLTKAIELKIGGKISSRIVPLGLPRSTSASTSGIEPEYLKIYNSNPPPLVDSYLSGTGLKWYNLALRLPSHKVDSIFTSIAKSQGKTTYIGAGSDLTSILLEVPKRVLPARDGLVGEVNFLMPKDIGIREGFGNLEVSAPFFRGRPAGKVSIGFNPESGHDLETWIANSKANKPITDGKPQILVPLKHLAIAEITPQGEVTLYFRTKEDYQTYLNRKLTLPSVEKLNPTGWLDSLPKEDRVFQTQENLIYAGVLLARGAPNGWSFESRSLEFLRKLSTGLNSNQLQQVRMEIGNRLRHHGSNPAPLEFVFETLKLSLSAP